MSTGIPGGINFPTGNWPDMISFNKKSDTYKWSEGTSVQIQALDHVHVINYDQDGAEPYTMELIMPVMENLPSSSRMYFFYVSRCHDQDLLTFSVVPLSGNSVNNVIGSYTFTLSGDKTLFVCVGVGSNYIIHPINLNIPLPTPVVPPYLRGVFFNQDSTPAAATPVASFLGTSNDTIVPTSASYPPPNAVGDASMIGAFTENHSFGAGPYFGFQCNTAGFWSINYHRLENVTTTVAVNRLLGSSIFILDSTGTTVKFHYYGEQVSVGAGGLTSNSLIADEVKCPIDQGDIVLFASHYYSPGATYSSTTFTSSKITFFYLGEYPVVTPPALLMMAAPSSALALKSSSSFSNTSNEIVMGSANDTLLKRKELHKKMVGDQKAEKERRMKQLGRGGGGVGDSTSSGESSSSSSGGPSFSLSDVENIVRKVMQQQQQQQQQQTVTFQSTPSAPPSFSNAAGKKRVREDSSSSSDVLVVEDPRPTKK